MKKKVIIILSTITFIAIIIYVLYIVNLIPHKNYSNKDFNKIQEWQSGDIVVFKGHIGIVSDKRNSKGINFIIHHANPFQVNYEEDILEIYNNIIGHYRIS